MAKSEHNVISGNDLLGGHVVYWTAQETWSADMGQAVVLSAQDAANELNLANTTQNETVGAEINPVDASSAIPKPTKRRDAIRLNGPSPEVMVFLPDTAPAAIAAE